MNDVDAASAALSANDLPRAAHHVGEALAADPLDGRALALAQRLLTSVGDPVGFTALGDDATIAKAGLHAMALAVAHNFSEAFEVLFNLARQRPAVPYMVWGQTWIEQHPSAQLLDLEVVGPALSDFSGSFDDPVDPEDARHRNVTVAADILRRLHTTFNHARPLGIQALKLLRLAKRFDEALALAREEQGRDAFFGQMMEAWTRKDMEDPQGAIAAFMRAFEVNPDPSILLDVGDLQLQQGAFEHAVQTYGRVEQSAEEYAWAHPHHAAAQYLVSRDPRWFAYVEQLAQQGNEAAQKLVGDLTLFSRELPVPEDLTLGPVRGVFEQLRGQPPSDDAPTLGITVSNPESPTVALCMRSATATIGHTVNLKIKVDNIPQPDPRATLDVALGGGADPLADAFPLWRWSGTDATPAPAAPPSNVLEAVTSLACTPDVNLHAWLEKAKTIAPPLAGQAQALAAAMVHPRPLPHPEADPGEWVHRWQLAAAVLLARIDTGWGASQRRAALLGIAHGPIDWPIAVVIPVLEQIHNEDPTSRQEILTTFQKLHQRTPADGYTCYRLPLYACWSRLEPARRDIWSWYRYAARKPYL